MIDSRPIAEAVSACRRHLLAVAGFSAMLNLLYIAPTLYMLQVYSRVVPTHSRATLLFLTLAMLLALATLAALDGLRGRLLVRAGVRLDRQLAPLILSAALEPGAGQSARQVIREFDALRQVLSGPAVLAMVDAPWTPIYVLVCFVLHPYIGLAALAGIIVLPLLARLNDKATGGAMAESQARATLAYVAQDEMLAAADMVRGLGMRSAAIQRSACLNLPAGVTGGKRANQSARTLSGTPAIACSARWRRASWPGQSGLALRNSAISAKRGLLVPRDRSSQCSTLARSGSCAWAARR